MINKRRINENKIRNVEKHKQSVFFSMTDSRTKLKELDTMTRHSLLLTQPWMRKRYPVFQISRWSIHCYRPTVANFLFVCVCVRACARMCGYGCVIFTKTDAFSFVEVVIEIRSRTVIFRYNIYIYIYICICVYIHYIWLIRYFFPSWSVFPGLFFHLLTV
jgi:hypothetical protein